MTPGMATTEEFGSVLVEAGDIDAPLHVNPQLFRERPVRDRDVMLSSEAAGGTSQILGQPARRTPKPKDFTCSPQQKWALHPRRAMSP